MFLFCFFLFLFFCFFFFSCLGYWRFRFVTVFLFLLLLFPLSWRRRQLARERKKAYLIAWGVNSCSLVWASYCSFPWQICPFEESVGIDFLLFSLVLTPFCPKEEAIESALKPLISGKRSLIMYSFKFCDNKLMKNAKKFLEGLSSVHQMLLQTTYFGHIMGTIFSFSHHFSWQRWNQDLNLMRAKA